MKKTILLVDDERELAEMMKIHLESKGYGVLVAYDGVEGYKKACKEKPDLIILDLMLPKVDGYEVCEKLKSNKKHKKIPIIMLTAHGRNLDLERIVAREFGANAFITKPFEPQELFSKIRELLKKR